MASPAAILFLLGAGALALFSSDSSKAKGGTEAPPGSLPPGVNPDNPVGPWTKVTTGQLAGELAKMPSNWAELAKRTLTFQRDPDQLFKLAVWFGNSGYQWSSLLFLDLSKAIYLSFKNRQPVEGWLYLPNEGKTLPGGGKEGMYVPDPKWPWKEAIPPLSSAPPGMPPFVPPTQGGGGDAAPPVSPPAPPPGGGGGKDVTVPPVIVPTQPPPPGTPPGAPPRPSPASLGLPPSGWIRANGTVGYIVQQNDQTVNIAKKFGRGSNNWGAVKQLVGANPQVKDWTKVFAGNDLNIPDDWWTGARTPTTRPPPDDPGMYTGAPSKPAAKKKKAAAEPEDEDAKKVKEKEDFSDEQELIEELESESSGEEAAKKKPKGGSKVAAKGGKKGQAAA